MLNVLIKNFPLITSLTKREIEGRYKGSFMGLLWSFLVPLLMLGVYTFVFSVVFQARWDVEFESKTGFALVLFTGLIFFNLFSECISKAPTLIIANANFVKKVVFPLEILPVVALFSALYQLLISFAVWLIFYFIFFGVPPKTIFFIIPLLIPFVIFILGISWFLSALGVYIRDIGQVIGVLVTIMMFMSPIFYPISIVPKMFQSLMLLSPLTFMVEEARSVMVYGNHVDWSGYFLHLFCALLIAYLGYKFFLKAKKGFADVL